MKMKKNSLSVFSVLFSLLFFVSCNENPLAQARKMDVQLPKDSASVATNSVVEDHAISLLLDGNKNGKIYAYEGKLVDSTSLLVMKFDSLQEYVAEKNKLLVADMNQLRLQKRKGGLSDSIFTSRKKEIELQHKTDTPMFIIKWGGNAKYSDVINVIDILKNCDVNQYALVAISNKELDLLDKKY